MTADLEGLVARLADVVLDHVLHPPGGDDPVVRWASPQALTEAFAGSVGLALADHEPAHGPASLEAAARAVLRYSVHTSHPRFVNQNFAGPDPVAVMGDHLAAALNTTNATYEAAPVFTLMERALLDKLARLAGYPTSGPIPPGLMSPGGSVATLMALQLARHRADPDVVRLGSGGARHAVFVSSSGHYATRKAAALLGLGTDAVYVVGADPTGAMVPEALDAAIRAAVDAGRIPLAVVATAGTTVTAAFDPLPALAARCEAHGLWLHVDGCWGGSALFSPRERHRLAGVEQSHSFVWNLHKMMGMTQQCSVLLVRDPTQLAPCFAAQADYLFQPDKAWGELDAGDRTILCGRRVDVLKAWLAYKAHGDAGFARRVEHAVDLAEYARARIAASEQLCAVVPGSFTNVCFVWVPPALRGVDLAALDPADRARLHALAPRIKARMQAEGTALIGYQPVHGLNAFRLLFANPRVTRDDVDALLALVSRYGTACWDP